MQTRKAGQFTKTKPGIQFFASLCLVGCCFVFSGLSASGQPFGGLLTVSNINFHGAPLVIDSFDSSDPTKSAWQTNWVYNGQNYGTYTNTLRSDDATVGTDSGYLNVSNSDIYGYVDTAPGGTVNTLKYGSVGELAWVNVGNSGIQPGHLLDDMNLVFSDVVLPTPANTYYPTPTWLSPGYFPTGTNIGGTIYYYVITNIIGEPGTPTNKIFWRLDFNAMPPNKASVFINASNAVLYLTNGISMKNGDNLTLNTNGNVDIYLGGTFDVANGLVNNLTQYAPAFRIYGLPGCTSILFGLNPVLTIWLYAPEASVLFSPGGAADYNVVGALTCHDLTDNGHFNFHFDEALGAHVAPWIISQPTNQIVHVGSNAMFTVNVGGILQDGSWTSDNWVPPRYYGNKFTLVLPNVQRADIGHYYYIAYNSYGWVTSAPASLVIYTNATPTLTVDSGSTNGQFQFDILGVTGLNYSVQASTNLIDWVPLGTNVSPFTFLDTNAPLFPQRFYRSVFMQ